MKEKKLQGQIAIVTGASSGIGAGVAKALAAAGATVVINYPVAAPPPFCKYRQMPSPPRLLIKW